MNLFKNRNHSHRIHSWNQSCKEENLKFMRKRLKDFHISSHSFYIYRFLDAKLYVKRSKEMKKKTIPNSKILQKSYQQKFLFNNRWKFSNSLPQKDWIRSSFQMLQLLLIHKGWDLKKKWKTWWNYYLTNRKCVE